MTTPADRLIFELANGNRPATSADRAPIIQALLAAPFSRSRAEAQVWDQRPGAKIVGTPHPVTGDRINPQTVLTSLEAHLAKRIEDESWPPGTTPEQYLADLKSSIAAPSAELFVGFRDGNPLVCVFTPVGDLAGLSLNQADGDIFVLYNARFSCITTGYWIEEGERSRAVRKWRPRQRVP